MDEKKDVAEIFKIWLATSPLASALKVGLGFLLTAAVMTWTSTGTIDFGMWQTWVIGALGVAVPIIVNYLNDDDRRYGRKKKPVEAAPVVEPVVPKKPAPKKPKP